MYDPQIRSHARHRPHAIAVASLQGEVTYACFDADIDRIACAILESGHGDVRLATVALADAYVHWLVLLALGRLGIASATVGTLGAAKTNTLLNADLLITDRAEETPGGSVLSVTREWIEVALRQPIRPAPPVRRAPDGLARVTLSSGTTGTPKIIGRSWSQLAAFVTSTAIESTSVTTQVDKRRCLYMYGADTVAYYFILAQWALGATMLLGFGDLMNNPEQLGALAPTQISGSALQLQMLAGALSKDFAPLPNLNVISSGSNLPAHVSAALRMKLTTNVWNYYASTEAGLVARGQAARLDADCVGWVEPGVLLEIVGEDDEPLPLGAIGSLRVKTPNMVAAYLADEDAGALSYRDGWFYPGDLGAVSEDGLLRIVGRSGEVINIGGMKFLPRTLEDAVLACKGVRDAAAFAVPSVAGVPTPWLAIVRDEDLDEDEIANALRGLRLPPIHLGWVSEIPRNDRGKVQRDRLTAAAQTRE